MNVAANNPTDPKPTNQPPKDPPEIDSRDLLSGGKELIIRHADQVYRLTLTRSGKLILRK